MSFLMCPFCVRVLLLGRTTMGLVAGPTGFRVSGRGVERWDPRPDFDFALAVLDGPPFYRLLVTGGCR